MTLLERWYAPEADLDCVRVNGCLMAYVDGCEVHDEWQYQRLLYERTAPLLWLAMPVHDLPKVLPLRSPHTGWLVQLP